MENQEYILRDGEFFRRTITERSLGSQREMLKKLSEDSSGYLCKNTHKKWTEIEYNIRMGDGLGVRKEAWSSNVHTMIADNFISLINEIPYVTYKCQMAFGVTTDDDYVITADFVKNRRWTDDARQPRILTLLVKPMEEEDKFYFISTYERKTQEFISSYLICKKNKFIFPVPVTNIYPDGKMCIGEFYRELNEDQMMIEKHGILFDFFAKEEGNTDLLNPTHYTSLAWNAKNLQPMEQYASGEVYASGRTTSSMHYNIIDEIGYSETKIQTLSEEPVEMEWIK